MQNLMDDLLKLLKKDERLVSQDGVLLKNQTQELARKNDPELIKLLLSDKVIKQHFFFEIAKALIFDKEKFVRFVSNKQFLPDSYTAFKNKIGLTSGDEYLSEGKEVVLAWPYKDCVLEGGMTKEDQKRDEVFYNETLAPDDINRLLDPKAFTNFKRIDKKGEHKLDGFNRDEKGTIKDNLIIKGNNLLALASLKKEFSGKVKLIYIDPPYNTGNDGFNYNDSFNHSSWLVFMKNRLEIARQLLSENGSFWISLNDEEVHYAKILCDEIFGRDNFISTIIWHSKYTTSNDAKFVSYQHENILFYAKNRGQFEIGGLDRTKKQNQSYRNPDNDPKGVWKPTPLHAKSGKEENNYTIEFPNGYKWTPPKGRYPRYSKIRLLEIYKENGLYFNKSGGVDKKTYLSEVKQSVTPGSVWGYDEVGHTHSNNEELAKLLGKGIFDNPKGTFLIKKICKVGGVDDEDIVLDYHAGSGTTAHAILDLNKEDGENRRFILCEQMNYAETITAKRVKKVIENNGDGDFVYMELAKWNEEWIEKVKNARTGKELGNLWDEMKETAFLSYKVDPKSIHANAKQYSELSLGDQKKLLIECLDKNQLYINLSEIEDKEYGVSKEDKVLNKDFYNGK